MGRSTNPDTPARVVSDERHQAGKLKPLGGSKSDDFNNIVVNQALATLWANSDPEGRKRQRNAVLAAMSGTRPRDEIEGMWRRRWLRRTTPQWNAFVVQ